MNEIERNQDLTQESDAVPPTANSPSARSVDSAEQLKRERQEARRWWIKLFVQPALILACGVVLIVGLGIAQRFGFISAGGGGEGQASAGGESVRYICPMMCTPPTSEPGRCPVCAMELVPATSGGGGDSHSVEIDSAARRVANIRTTAVQAVPMIRTIRAIGELAYDEGTLKSISAYVDGRLDRLYADYTGVVVEKGDHLALVYSPRLYSGQVELLLAKKAQERSESATLQRVVQSNRDLYESAKQRLIELGMTEPQIEQLEQEGEANSRIHLCAPISGTVIEKFAVEGEYVQEGQPIYKLADLSTVWLMLKLFPEDAATIRFGQQVEAEIQSLPGRKFTGRVAFVDPNVDPTTRTVNVRVVIPNDDGRLRIGDYAKATIDAPLTVTDGGSDVFDPDLADKWISPRHPHVVESSPGKCRVCGVDLVPAREFGFTADSAANAEALVVPRNAVLMAGDNSVLYVETEPGRFEIRQVVLGPTIDGQIVIVQGVEEGEQVAVQGNFLIDSQMQLAGNPSLIDPTRAQPAFEFELDESELPQMGTMEMALPSIEAASSPPSPTLNDDEDKDDKDVVEALAQLSTEDRALAAAQKICPVTEAPLGSTGTPIKVEVDNRPVFICCEACRTRLFTDPEKYLARLPKEASR